MGAEGSIELLGQILSSLSSSSSAKAKSVTKALISMHCLCKAKRRSQSHLAKERRVDTARGVKASSRSEGHLFEIEEAVPLGCCASPAGARCRRSYP